MAINEKTIKILWANAAGRCSSTDCNEKLTVGQAAQVAPHTLGEMAHIKGKKPGSNRYDEEQLDVQRDSYENLILLCPNHHTIIDKPENEDVYSVDVLVEMKLDHENHVNNCLDATDMKSIEQVKDKIAIYLSENKQAWQQYGPLSQIALKSPHSEELYAVWTSERLSTIVPNNRKIASLLTAKRDLFKRNDQEIISQFMSHVESYEKWVNDEISYQAVLQFPVDFEQLILGN